MDLGVIHLDMRVEFSVVISMLIIIIIGLSSQEKELMTFA